MAFIHKVLTNIENESIKLYEEELSHAKPINIPDFVNHLQKGDLVFTSRIGFESLLEKFLSSLRYLFDECYLHCLIVIEKDSKKYFLHSITGDDDKEYKNKYLTGCVCITEVEKYLARPSHQGIIYQVFRNKELNTNCFEYPCAKKIIHKHFNNYKFGIVINFTQCKIQFCIHFVIDYLKKCKLLKTNRTIVTTEELMEELIKNNYLPIYSPILAKI